MANKKKGASPAPEEAKKNPAPEEPVTEPSEEAAAETPEQPEQPAPDPKDAEIESLRAKLAETTDRLMRTLAEYDNFRKRSQKEKEAIYADTKAETVAKLLPVADNLERAALAGGDVENYKKGVEMTLRQLSDIFTALGVAAFGEPGDAFDPTMHNGVMHEENPDLPANSVSMVFAKGYKLGEKVIRPATVKVAN
jgi:molecular chaperone GrpE